VRTCGDVLRRGVAVGAHHPGGDVAAAACRAVLREAEVRKLRVVILREAYIFWGSVRESAEQQRSDNSFVYTVSITQSLTVSRRMFDALKSR
jgi:hypothetical protein